MLEPGKYYHIYNRGNNREDLFKEDRNYDYFLKLYEHHICPIADTFAYCLMRNHFHLLVKIKNNNTSQVLKTCEVLKPKINPSQSFSNLFNAYSKAINKAYNRSGSLFQDRFHRIEITSDKYFACLIHYIHFNPQRHGFTDNFRTYPYSSYQLFLSEKDTILERKQVTDWFGGMKDFIEFHDTVTEEKLIAEIVGKDD